MYEFGREGPQTWGDISRTFIDFIDDLSDNEDIKNDDEDIIEPLVNVIIFQIQACSLVVWDDC